MNAEELLKRAIASGADEKGIRDRFGDNTVLYDMCFRDFMVEPNFTVLCDAIAEKDYERAFDAAHALKGLSGNLGLTAFYSAIRTLVESLRCQQWENVEAEYAEVERQREQLGCILTEKPEKAEKEKTVSAQQELSAAKASGAEKTIAGLKKKSSRQLSLLLFAVVAALFALAYLFCQININYRKNVVAESGEHLVEMSNQISLYTQEYIAGDWKIARSVGDSILDSAYGDDDPAVFGMLQRKQKVWGVSELMLYTENGYCTYADGSTEKNDLASETVYNAREHGKYMSVIDSRIIYTVPLETQQRYGGSRIVAVSVVRDMSTFLDDMGFSSFDGSAWLYLTDENGVLISSLSNPSTVKAFNIQSVIKDMEITPLNEDCDAEEFLADPYAAAFLLSDGVTENYGVSAPVYTDGAPLHLFYFVPEEAVNSTTNAFSRQLTLFSLIIIILFALCAILASLLVYRSRKKLFDKAILARERMFDLLIKNTKTAFGLFSMGQTSPAYLSDNTVEVVGDRYWVVDKTENGYRVRNDRNIETDNTRQVNELLAGWDGKSVFRSGYLHNSHSVSAPYFSFELYPVGEDGENFVGIAQDVTQTYKREEATKSAMEMAKRSNEAKTRFLSNMSHDVRTPMNAIMNMSNFALESIDRPKKLGVYLHVIHESAEHLLHLINDVLDMSRIESGQTVVASTPFDIIEELERQVNMVRPLCQAKEQTLMTDFSGLRETAVCGDALKLSQIVMNLLSNAMKFTPEKGAVRFSAKELPSLRNDIMSLRLTVEDNGMGISEEDRKHIFEPFSRANDKAVSKIEGTGLGLSICKNYVDAMGGIIRCDSEQGEGSTFTVELFFRRSNAALLADDLDTALAGVSFLGMHCLVAEDNATNQLIAKELLERLGFMVDFADDGGEAVRKFLTSPQDTYDVIYMDIQMPVLDGYEASVQIRASDHPQAKTIPIIAMTANAFAEDIEKARAVGMDAYVYKPIVSFHLAEQTTKAIQKKRGSSR